jgi:alkylation response protein AidB-like acyl-CoA dehydrogenase
VWWNADHFTGNPSWRKLLAFAPARLSDEEQQFRAGPVEELCAMLDDWKINWELHDLPSEVWDFLKAKRFFAMIIPKSFGGLGFSAYAHSEVISLALGGCHRNRAELARSGRRSACAGLGAPPAHDRSRLPGHQTVDTVRRNA